MKTYWVLRGCHYSNFFPAIKFARKSIRLEQTLVFDKSCVYDIAERSCVNKLFGFCFGFGVHSNSVRFGWSYDKPTGLITIHRYVYDEGTLYKNFCTRVSIESPHTYRLEANWNGTSWNVDFIVDERIVAAHYGIKAHPCFITTLGLYFGGNTRAPHTIKIRRLYNTIAVTK